MEKEFNQGLFFERIYKKNAVILSTVSPNLNAQEYNFKTDLKKGNSGEVFIKNI